MGISFFSKCLSFCEGKVPLHTMPSRYNWKFPVSVSQDLALSSLAPNYVLWFQMEPICLFCNNRHFAYLLFLQTINIFKTYMFSFLRPTMNFAKCIVNGGNELEQAVGWVFSQGIFLTFLVKKQITNPGNKFDCVKTSVGQIFTFMKNL